MFRPYIESILRENEEALIERPHIIVVYLYVFLSLVFGVSFGFTYTAGLYPLAVSSAGGFVMGIIATISIAVYRVTTEYGLTTERVIKKEGFISRDTAETRLEKIESVRVKQSILGRIFNYGTLYTVGTGGGVITMRYLPDPYYFQEAIKTVFE